MKDFLRAVVAQRLHGEQLRGYAPDKSVELTRIVCADLARVRTELIPARERLWRRKGIVRARVRRCGRSDRRTGDNDSIAIRTE